MTRNRVTMMYSPQKQRLYESELTNKSADGIEQSSCNHKIHIPSSQMEK